MKVPNQFFILLMLLMSMEPPNTLANDLETKVKAAYIYNFTKFVDWGDTSANILNVCIVGQSAIFEILSHFVPHISTPQLNIYQVDIANLTQCQVLFIDQSEKRLTELIAKFGGIGVLTVSDAKNFVKKGGVIGFYIDGGKLKFEINPKIAEASNLKISAKLMEVARIVY